MPSPTAFYRSLLDQMRRGFEACGVTVSGGLAPLGPDALAQWCTEVRPDVVFEMNRPRNDARGLAPEVRHATWVVDFDGRTLDHFAGSDATYLFGPTWVDRYPHDGFHRWLGPGTCPSDYPQRACTHEVDVSFAGYIPRPWNESERQRPLTADPAGLRFGELLPEFESRLRAARDRLRTADDFIELAASACRGLSGSALVLDDRLRRDLSGRVIRELNRRDLIDATLRASASLAIYGPDKWTQWPAYAQYHRGFIECPRELHQTYVEAALSLHEGNGIHFRSMDVMGSGGLMLFRRTFADQLEGGIESRFEPGVHYMPVTLESLPSTIERLLADPRTADRIRTAAAREVAQGHTWRHRAQSILDDFARL